MAWLSAATSKRDPCHGTSESAVVDSTLPVKDFASTCLDFGALALLAPHSLRWRFRCMEDWAITGPWLASFAARHRRLSCRCSDRMTVQEERWALEGPLPVGCEDDWQISPCRHNTQQIGLLVRIFKGCSCGTDSQPRHRFLNRPCVPVSR